MIIRQGANEVCLEAGTLETSDDGTPSQSLRYR